MSPQPTGLTVRFGPAKRNMGKMATEEHMDVSARCDGVIMTMMVQEIDDPLIRHLRRCPELVMRREN